jgi:hypothetical protein
LQKLQHPGFIERNGGDDEVDAASLYFIRPKRARQAEWLGRRVLRALVGYEIDGLKEHVWGRRHYTPHP